jgi:hypothetical protein
MELTAALAKRGLWLNLEWIPRELNVEADALTNLEFGSFDPALRIPVSWSDLPFDTMEALLKEGLLFEAELEARKQLTADTKPTKNRKRRRTDKTAWAA